MAWFAKQKSDGSVEWQKGDGSAVGHKIDATGKTIHGVNHGTTIASPTGGGTIDAQARTAIDAIRAVLTSAGLTP